MIGTTAVQPVGDLSVGSVVLLDVGVQQQQRYPAHLSQPDLGQKGTTGQRQRIGVEQRVALLLPSGPIERLPKVALAVQQTDADDRDAQIARRLEMITSK